MYNQQWMALAISEAKASLRGGNDGFGAVVVCAQGLAAKAQDTRSPDPQHHAISKAITMAKQGGHTLAGGSLFTTARPCPRCAAEIAASGISFLFCGEEEPEQDGFSVANFFAQKKPSIKLVLGFCAEDNAVLYRADVRREVERLRGKSPDALKQMDLQAAQERQTWVVENRDKFPFVTKDLLDSAYRLILHCFGETEEETPVFSRTATELVYRLTQFCPILEACKILEIDTRQVCKNATEEAMNAMVKALDPNLSFERNYNQIRPYAGYCEEKIVFTNPI